MESAGAFPLDAKNQEENFEVIFLENYKRIYGVLYRLTGQKAEAEDLTMEAFSRLWRRAPKDSDRLKGWLYRVAVRLGYNSLRNKAPDLLRRELTSAAGRDARIHRDFVNRVTARPHAVPKQQDVFFVNQPPRQILPGSVNRAARDRPAEQRPPHPRFRIRRNEESHTP